VPVRTEAFRAANRKRRWGLWLAWSTLAFLFFFSLVLILSVYDAGPILRQRVVQTLSDRFDSKVELRAFHVTIANGFQVSGQDLRIYGQTDPNTHQLGIQPLISIGSFDFKVGIWNLLRTPTHIDTVLVRGLSLNIPPNNDRKQITRMRKSGGKAKIYVNHFICDHAQLVINTATTGKFPLVFDIQNLVMDETAPGQALRFEADLANPKPV